MRNTDVTADMNFNAFVYIEKTERKPCLFKGQLSNYVDENVNYATFPVQQKKK